MSGTSLAFVMPSAKLLDVRGQIRPIDDPPTASEDTGPMADSFCQALGSAGPYQFSWVSGHSPLALCRLLPTAYFHYGTV
jgi:hypothetical protein